MEVRELTETEKMQFPNMDYCIEINAENHFFSKNALFELNQKISRQFKNNVVLGTVSNSLPQTCDCEGKDMGNAIDDDGRKYCLNCGYDC